MNRGIVTLRELLGGLKLKVAPPESPDTPGNPEPVKAPRPQPPKVVGDPTRAPVNRQAAMMTARAGWLYQPFPSEPPPKSELEKLRESNRSLRAENERLQVENKSLRRRIGKMERNPKVVTVKVPAVVPAVAAPALDADKIQILERLKNGR